MANKLPLYFENGRIQQFGFGDTISAAIAPGSGGGGGGGGPSWANGAGERRFLVKATASGGSTGNPGQTLSAATINEFYWTTGSTTKSLIYEFPSPINITGISFSQSSNAANGIWTLAASTDGTSWTNIITDYVLGGSSYGPLFVPPGNMYAREFSNSNSYKYYRLTLNSGQSTSNGPYIQQVLFKCEVIT